MAKQRIDHESSNITWFYSFLIESSFQFFLHLDFTDALLGFSSVRSAVLMAVRMTCAKSIASSVASGQFE